MASINKTINTLESHEEVGRTDVEYTDDEGGLVVSAFVDELSDDFVNMVEEDLGMEIENEKYVVFGYELTIA